MTADALGVGLASVNRVMADYNKDPESINRLPIPRGCPKYVVSDTHEEAVRSFIRQGNKEGCPITLELIKDFLYQRDPNEESFLNLGYDCPLITIFSRNIFGGRTHISLFPYRA